MGPTFGLINQAIGAGMSGTTLAFSFLYFLFTRAKGQGVWLHTRLTEQINILRIMQKRKARINPVVLFWNWKYQSEFVVLYIERRRNRQLCVCVYMHTYFLTLLIGPRSSNTHIAMNTPSTQILVSKFHSSQKEISVPWRYYPKSGAGKIQVEPGTLSCIRK